MKGFISYTRLDLFCYTQVRVRISRNFWAAILGAIVVPVTVVSQGTPSLTQRDGESFARKLADISESGKLDGVDLDPVILFEREVNSYLRYQAASSLPQGIAEVSLSLGDDGRVTVNALVNLSLLTSASASGSINPLAYLRGVMPVVLSGVLEASDGEALAEIDAVTVGGIPIPFSVLKELIRSHSQSEAYPDGIDVFEPLHLPYGIVEIQVTRGQALIIR